MLKTIEKNARELLRRVLWYHWSEKEKARKKREQQLELLKKLLLEYYSSFALTIFQGVVFFTQRTMDEMVLIKPAYHEAQERYKTVIEQLNQLKRSLSKDIRLRVDRMLNAGKAIIVQSSEASQGQNGHPQSRNQYDFIIDIMAVQKQCMDLVSDLEDHTAG